MNLSIIVPSIRIKNWEKWIEKISHSCTQYSFEIIFIGPYYDNCIEPYKNIKYIRDFGHPNRCQQLGILFSEGEYVTFASDDCLYKKEIIDKCLNICYTNKLDFLTTGYYEGGNNAISNFSIKHCYKSGYNIKNNWVIFNSVFIKRQLAETYNLDTEFAVTCIGHADLASRVQYNKLLLGAVLNDNIMECDHLPGRTGDHSPICDSQTNIDEPNFYIKYNNKQFPNTNISWNAWKDNTSPIWKERFR